MQYTVYILLSSKLDKTYVGYANDLNNRLKEHNNGESYYSKRFKPWIVVYTELFETKLEAIKREKYFKSAAGRRWIKKNLFNN